MKITILKAIIWMLNYLFAGVDGMRNGIIFLKNKLFEKSIPEEPKLEEKKLKKYKILPCLHHRPKDYPYPIYDWKNEKIYKKKCSTKELAWEFLRRNKKYQYDTDRYKFKGHFPEFNLNYRRYITLEFQKEVTNDYHRFGRNYLEIEFINKQICEYYAYRLVEQKDGTTVPIEEVIREVYGLSHIRLYKGSVSHLDPKLDLPKHSFFVAKTEYVDEEKYNPDFKKQKSLAPIKPEHFVVRFNAKEDIPKQIRSVKRELKNLREKHGKFHKGNLISNEIYIKYLRVLDAVSAGMCIKDDYEEIIKIVDPELWKVWTAFETSTHPTSYLNDWLNEANTLVNSKYLTLLNK